MPLSTAATTAAVYAASVFASGAPRYVPMPSDETVRPCASRKCPSAARPAKRRAYAAVFRGSAFMATFSFSFLPVLFLPAGLVLDERRVYQSSFRGLRRIRKRLLCRIDRCRFL